MSTFGEELKTLVTQMTTIRDERGMYANTATRIGNAFLALLDYIYHAPFLRKDQEDSTSFLLTLLAGAVIGESKNITLNPDGSIRCGSIYVDGSATFQELVFNHQNVLEGDTYFTDRGIIEKVEHTDVRQYKLTFRKEYAEERHTFHVNDIILGKVNNLDTARTYRSFWLRVDSVDLTANTATCSMWKNADVPGGKNYPPEETARVIRWGNTIDESRQSIWFVSSNDGRWLFLQGVNKPILEDSEHGSNYAGFIGLPAEIQALKPLIDKGVVNKYQPYLYFRGIVVQDIIKTDYLGNPEYTNRDCGTWNPKRKYIRGYDETAKGYYADHVWWGGCYWMCAVDSCTNSEPRFNNTDWVCKTGGANMNVKIHSSEGDAFRAHTDWTTDLIAVVMNAEMELQEDEIGLANIVWTRESDDDTADAAWNAQHKAGTDGLTLHVDSKVDIPGEWKAGVKIGFRCTVSFPDHDPYEGLYTIQN